MKRKTEAGKKIILMGLLAFTLLIPNWAAGAQTDFDKFVVFGTSLSDPGNFFASTGDQNLPPEYDLDPDSGVPLSAYAVGGHHLTNGAPWIVQLAKPLGLEASVLPASRDENPNAMNYAFDGTRAEISGLHMRSLLVNQVDQFLIDDLGFDEVTNPTPVSPDAMIVVEIGSNDVRDAIIAVLVFGNFGLAVAIIDNAIAAIDDQVQRLNDAGARQFLYVNVPDVLLTPALNPIAPSLPPFVKDFIDNNIVANFNTQLDGIFTGLLPGTESTEFDFFQLTEEVVADPGDFGLENTTDACITPMMEAPYICRVPDDYLFWDAVHPSKAAHAIMAGRAAEAL